jgi:transposase
MTQDSLTRPATVIGVGIDTARYGHHVTFLREDLQPATKSLTIEESREGYRLLEQTLEQLSQRHPGVHFRVRIDAAGQYATNLERFLRQLPWSKSISVGQPNRNQSYRKAHFPKRKSDATDSYCNARFAVVERPTETCDVPVEFQQLREVVARVEALSRQSTRLINQLHGLLARVFPELALLAPNVEAGWVLELLSKYPMPEKIARAKRASLTAIAYLSEEKAEALQKAARETVGSAKGQIVEELVRQQVDQLQRCLADRDHYETLIQQAYQALPASHRPPLDSIPGIGVMTAAVLVAKIVSMDRFATPAQLVSYFGVFPEENTSGVDKHGNPIPPGTMYMSRQGNDLVRRYLWNAAKSASQHNPMIKAFYARLRSHGKSGGVAYGHCMRKLLHLVFAVWKTGKPFDPQHYAWEKARPEAMISAEPATPSPPAAQEAAASHMQETCPEGKVVIAASSSVSAASQPVNGQPASANGTLVDYAALRAQVSLEQVLAHLGHLPQLKGPGPQRRGPCPIHDSQNDHGRSFSVHLDQNVFQCFDAECGQRGNVLDLWAALHKLPLYEAALHLADTFNIPLQTHDQRRGTRMKNAPSNPCSHGTSKAKKKGVITPDAP